MPIDVGKIIMLVLVITGFVIGIIFLKKTLDKNCTIGDIFDEKLGKCIPDCSLVPGTSYDSDKDKCIQNCPAGSKMCGTFACYDEATQQCLKDKFICSVGDQLCPDDDGTGTSSVCFNPDNSKCINGIVYSNTKACSNTLGCGADSQCSINKKTCIPCPDTQVLCNDVCCPSNKVCGDDGTTCTSCKPGETPYNGLCCKTGQTGSIDENGSPICCDTKLCGKTCCAVGNTCTNETGTQQCCDPNRIYQQTATQQGCCVKDVCIDKTTGKKTCCTGTDEECQNGICMTKCNTPEGAPLLYCNQNIHEFCMNATDANGGQKYYCGHDKCQFEQLSYIPGDFKVANNNTIPTFQKADGTDIKYYISNPKSIQGLTREVKSDYSPRVCDANGANCQEENCDVNDCSNRLAESHINENTVNIQTGYCAGSFDPTYLSITPLIPATCPFTDTKRCCTENSTYTGQVCKENEVCGKDGVCGNYTDKCRVIMPRCAVCNGDKTNPKCEKADEGFDVNNCAVGTGCQMIEDTFYWDQFTGESVHYYDEENEYDNNSCKIGTGAYRDSTSYNRNTIYSSNYCYTDDLRKILKFKNTDTTGLNDLGVSGVSLNNSNTHHKTTYYLPLHTDLTATNQPYMTDWVSSKSKSSPFMQAGSDWVSQRSFHTPFSTDIDLNLPGTS